MYNIDFTEYDRTFSKNAIILEKCSFRDNENNFYFISLASLKPADVLNILTVTFKIMSEKMLSLN
jgi:hypothetical protein